MNILCIPITVSEHVVGNLYCNTCSPQNWVIGEQWLNLTDADIVTSWLIFWKCTNTKHWPLNIKIRTLPVSLPSPLSCCPGTGCHWAPLTARPTSGSVTMATGRKSRCSTWEGCTPPLLLPLWEEEKPIHCEIIAFRNIFLPSRAIKEGMGILIHTTVAVTSTLKDAGNDQMHLLLHATSKLLLGW